MYHQRCKGTGDCNKASNNQLRQYVKMSEKFNLHAAATVVCVCNNTKTDARLKQISSDFLLQHLFSSVVMELKKFWFSFVAFRAIWWNNALVVCCFENDILKTNFLALFRAVMTKWQGQMPKRSNSMHFSFKLIWSDFDLFWITHIFLATSLFLLLFGFRLFSLHRDIQIETNLKVISF